MSRTLALTRLRQEISEFKASTVYRKTLSQKEKGEKGRKGKKDFAKV